MNDVPLRPNLIDPITLEVLRNALESIADEMGAVLRRTSFSPNIKERMDASCAIFDASAQLVARSGRNRIAFCVWRTRRNARRRSTRRRHGLAASGFSVRRALQPAVSFSGATTGWRTR